MLKVQLTPKEINIKIMDTQKEMAVNFLITATGRFCNVSSF